MPTYTPPIDDYMFVVDDVLGVHERDDLPGFDEFTPGLTRPSMRLRGVPSPTPRVLWHCRLTSSDSQARLALRQRSEADAI
jgi:hypothetical protein